MRGASSTPSAWRVTKSCPTRREFFRLGVVSLRSLTLEIGEDTRKLTSVTQGSGPFGSWRRATQALSIGVVLYPEARMLAAAPVGGRRLTMHFDSGKYERAVNR